MKRRVQKWGNSLAIRIPKSLASETGITEDSSVEISVTKGKIIIVPVPRVQYTLQQLLAGVTPDNCHPEWDTGPPVGKEIW